MQYLGRFLQADSERVRSILDIQWGLLEHSVHLIASCSYPFPEVMRALSNPMCVFPIEGLPGERYFPAAKAMDEIENCAEDLLRDLFGAGEDYRATIQPHSGTQANQVVFNAILKPEDTVLSLRPQFGGHISHSVLVGRRNRVESYGLTAEGTIDYSALEGIAQRTRPRLIIAGGSACPREIDFERISRVARGVNAMLHADISHTATFIAAGLHRPVVPYADFVTFNTVKNLRGPNGGVLIYRAEHHKSVNRGLFPDTQGGPNENTMFAKLVALDMLSRIDIRSYASKIIQLARTIASALMVRGVSVVTAGTDSHLVLIDLRPTGRTGLDVEQTCERHCVLVNRNLVPEDTRKPSIASGVRLGTACIAILGYSDDDARRLGHWLADRISGSGEGDPDCLIRELTGRYNHELVVSDRL